MAHWGAGALLLCGPLSACSSGKPEPRYVAPAATDAPGLDALLDDGAVVPAGEWGVVRYVSPDDTVLMAIRLTGVVTGEAGDLADVTVFGVDDIAALTPDHISYVWVILSGDPLFYPTKRLVATGPDDPLTLSLPSSKVKCDPPPAIDYSAPVGHEQRGCATVAFADVAPDGLVFRGPEGTSEGVIFELPSGM